jgi:PAS domain S-box-containing protein
MAAANESDSSAGAGLSTRVLEVVARFEDAWQHGRRAALADYLPADGDERWAALVELVHVDLERRLKAGELVRVEAYLYAYPELANDAGVVVDLLAAEYDLRRREEPGLGTDEYVRRFPQHRDPLQARLHVPAERRAPVPPTAAGTGRPETQRPRPTAMEAAPDEPATLPPRLAASEDSLHEARTVPPASTPAEDPYATRVTPLPADAAQSPWPSVDGYEIVGELGRGGMGVVYKARQVSLDRVVALKMALATANATLEGRFFREAQITGQLQHPGIVPVYELAQLPDNGQLFYIMRFVNGRTLSEAARTYHQRRVAGQAGFDELLSLLNAFVTICNTIAYAHSRGIIHRDLKGQNVILGDFSEVLVLDWGLAKRVDRPDGAVPSPVVLNEEASADAQLSVLGQALGTPAYMAPEQAAGLLDQIDCRTDIYGLGAMLYEILTGHPPFWGSDLPTLLCRVCVDEPLPPRQLWPDVPSDLEAVCMRAIAKNPAERYASATELAQVVQGWQESQRKRAERALGESEAFYHSLVESLPQCIIRKDLQGRFTYANQGACRFLGRSLEQILGKTDYDLCPAPMADKYRKDDKLVLETGKILETMEELRTLTGPKMYVQTTKTPVYDSLGAPIGIQVILWDVTDRKQLEEALRQTAAELGQARQLLQQSGIALSQG